MVSELNRRYVGGSGRARYSVKSRHILQPKMGPPQRRMAFVGKRKCQATGGISCWQEIERSGLCIDEKQGGTA